MLDRLLVAAATLAAGIALGSAPAIADEAWNTEAGVVVYEADVGNYAHLSLADGAMFIEGLPGNTQNRDTFLGYWIDYDVTGDDPVCEVVGTDVYGNESWSWGYVQMTFLDPAFPSRWSLAYTECDRPDIVGTLEGTPQ